MQTLTLKQKSNFRTKKRTFAANAPRKRQKDPIEFTRSSVSGENVSVL